MVHDQDILILMEKIPVSLFKATCLKLFSRMKKTGLPVMVTRNGEPLAIVYPAQGDEDRAPFGAMKGTVVFHGDPTEPLPEKTWEVLK